MEIWKEIPGFEGKYSASTFGRVKSLSRIKIRTSKCGIIYESIIQEKILTSCKIVCANTSYEYVNLYNKKLKRCAIHRLVGLTFIPNPNNFKLVMHLDDNGLNNHINNLKWGTHKDNMDDMVSKKRNKNRTGTNNGMSKLSENDVKEIIYLFNNNYYYGIQKDLSIKFKCSKGTINNIVKGNNWKHI
jgi:hypothetical protein